MKRKKKRRRKRPLGPRDPDARAAVRDILRQLADDWARERETQNVKGDNRE